MKLPSLFAFVAASTLIAGLGAQAQQSDAPTPSAVPVAVMPNASNYAFDATAPSDVSSLNRTSGRDSSLAKFASGAGTYLFLGAGTLLPLVEDGKDGQQHAIRTADALISSTIIAEGLKRVVHKKRPDGSDYQSFPSGHATAVFAVATMQAHYHPKQAILWYAGATAISASRVTLRKHDTFDVLAGAALGYAGARLELGQNRGLILRPFVHQGAPDNRVTGVSVSKSF